VWRRVRGGVLRAVPHTVTILFSDVVDSTGLGERLDPETLSHVLTDYFEGVKPAIERHGGTLAKFIGDAVMAVYA
jgi:class 3 adenylate cyclase